MDTTNYMGQQLSTNYMGQQLSTNYMGQHLSIKLIDPQVVINLHVTTKSICQYSPE